MKDLLIKEIPEEGMTLEALNTKDPWLQEVMEKALEEGFQKGDTGEVRLYLIRTGANVDLSGEVTFNWHPPCVRCLQPFPDSSSFPVHLLLAPLYESERQLRLEQKGEVALVKEDLEFAYYENDSFPLGDFIQEQILLAVPMQPLCKFDCQGLCPKCGSNLNEGACGCPPSQPSTRWDALKAFKG